jgi:hypothetical protein
VLNRLVGTDPVDVGKTALLLFMTLIAAVALQQVAASRSSQTAGGGDRVAVLSVARDFGRELTTYDYAHTGVQVNRLQPLVTREVIDRVRAAYPDLEVYRVVSVGETPDVYIETLDSGQGRALVQTRSIMQSQYAPSGTRTTGLLLCSVQREGSVWRVSDYQWLTPVTEGVSLATRITPDHPA